MVTPRRILPEPAKTALRWVRRTLRLSPMQRVWRELVRRGIRGHQLRALEVFGADGDRQLKDYAPFVARLEIWEIDPKLEGTLRRSFPKATVKIVDAYEEIRKTTEKYDLIVADAPNEVHGGHSEHFDLFPGVFRIASESAVIIVNVLPQFDEEMRRHWSFLFHADEVETQLARRQSFYKTMTPERVGLEEAVAAYRDLIKENGFELEWYFFQKRHYLHYLVLKVRRSAVREQRAP